MTIQALLNHFEKKQINLDPGFQRDSVWSLADRKELIKSIFMNYPLPSIFLYRRKDPHGRMVYDVIDGKQRIESVLMFMGAGRFRGKRFPVRLGPAANDPDEELWDWTRIKRRCRESDFTQYRLQTVEVVGDLSDIIDLFVRINSTGKKLTSAEKRHARYYNSEFLKQAGRLAERYRRYFLDHRILSAGAITRMKHVELTCELMASIAARGLLDKKKSLDGIIGGQSIRGRSLQQCADRFTQIANLVARIFPRLRETRFANAVDYYSLFMIIWELEDRHCVFSMPTRNRQAETLLIQLSQGVDRVRQQQRKAEGASPEQQDFVDYLMTVQGDTDSHASRERRARILRGLLHGLFEQKDTHRSFSSEQRRLIWHGAGARRCVYPGCNETLDWNNFTIDHIKPFSKGGKTSVANAALMCRKHNSQKGNR